MRLRTIQLRNFRPYFGKVKLDFPDEAPGELFLIHGLNGYGKTSLLLAVQWALYGEAGRRDIYDHVNTKARTESNLVISVELDFEHDGNQYRLVREARPLREPVNSPEDVGRSRLTLYRDGTPLPNDQVAQERIEAILPRDASQFFLFDGEKIHRYAASSLTEDTRLAIELVLGLRAVQNAKEDAGDLKASLRRQRNQALRRTEEHSRLADDLEQLEGQLQGAQRGDAEASERLQKYHAELQAHRDDLGELEEVQALASQRDQLSKDATEIRDQLAEVVDKMKNEAQGLYLRALLPRVAEAYEACQSQYEQIQEAETRRRLSVAVRQYLEKLSAADTCVCGRPLDETHAQHIRGLASAIEDEPPEESDEAAETLPEIAARLRLLGKAHSTANAAAQRYDELKVQKVTLEEKLSGAESAILDLDSRMRSIDVESVNSLRELIDKLEEEIGRTNREKGAFQEQTRLKSDEMSRLEKQVTKIGSASGTVKVLDAQIDLLERTERAFDELLRRSAIARREQIGSRCNEIFKSVTNKQFGYDSMFINEDFTFGIRAESGAAPNMDTISEGEKQVVAFSFIMGLNRHAKASAPLMIDTPMARLDQTHRRNLAHALGTLNQQVVLFVTDTDLGFGVGEIFNEFVEQEFEIQHDERTLTSTIGARG